MRNIQRVGSQYKSVLAWTVTNDYPCHFVLYRLFQVEVAGLHSIVLAKAEQVGAAEGLGLLPYLAL